MASSSQAKRAGHLFILLLLGLMPAAAQADAPAGPTQAPILRIEAGGPTSAVTHVSVDAAGTLMAAASYDKTVRLYSLPDDIERSVLRPPIGAREEGELYAVALTPDGKTCFAAGATGGAWDGSFSIYMFNVAQNRLVARLPGLPSPVYDLAVSPDGTRLAAGLAKGGVLVWDAHTGRSLFTDTAYTAPVRNLRFDKQNDLFSASADGYVRGYDASGRRFAKVQPEPGLRPWGLAVSPDGGFVAVTFENDHGGHPVVDVLAEATLAKAFVPDTTGLTGEGLLAVGWAGESGGISLLAGGYARNGQGNVIRRWGDFGLGAHQDYVAAHDTIRDIKSIPGGGAVYATDDPGWGRVGPDAAIALLPEPAVADLRPARGNLGISADGMAVEFKTASALLKFDANARTLTAIPALDSNFTMAQTAAPGETIRNWQDTDAPSVNGAPLQLDHEEYSRSLAIFPGGQSFLLGTDTELRVYNDRGKLLSETPVDAAAWALSISADGKTVVAALTDGTLHWYGVAADGTLTPRATLFAAADQTRWVLFTPAGFFDEADLGGQNLVGFHVNLGANQQPEWVSFSQAFRLFHAPDVVRAALAGDNGPQNTALAAIGDLHDRLIHEPVITILSACAVSVGQCSPVALSSTASIQLPVSATALQLTAQIKDQGLGVGPTDIFVNGRNTGRQAAPALTGGSAQSQFAVPLDPGTDDVILRQYDGGNAIYAESPPLRITRAGPVIPSAPVAAGTLYVLAIGIDHFVAGPSLNLNFAVSDAQSFAELVKQAASPVYANVRVTVLTETQATRAGILTALGNIAAQAQPGDTFLFYIASHGGVNATDGRFLLIPQDITNLTSWQSIEDGAITENALITALASIRARDSLLFIDTCYAGNVSAASLANVGQETGRYIISASSSAQEALDSYNGRDGVLIYALREAFMGDAPHDSHGIIGALSLGEYMSERVGELARQRNHTQDAEFTAAQSQLNSFPVGEVMSQ
jgi:DNA-binding beta-propeller fold protein YncE